jgi:hypothetical protein
MLVCTESVTLFKTLAGLDTVSRRAIPATLVGRAQTGQIRRLCRYSSKRVIDNARQDSKHESSTYGEIQHLCGRDYRSRFYSGDRRDTY